MIENDSVQKKLEKKPVGKNWLRSASGIALMVTAAAVVLQSAMRDGYDHLYFGTSLMAVFGYLFLTSRTKEEERDSPWWW
jgi:hypothetical protein